jgi:hypothetical protein
MIYGALSSVMAGKYCDAVEMIDFRVFKTGGRKAA